MAIMKRITAISGPALLARALRAWQHTSPVRSLSSSHATPINIWAPSDHGERRLRSSRLGLSISSGKSHVPPASSTCNYQASQRRNQWQTSIGAEPGVDIGADEPERDISKPQYDVESEIKIIDYSAKRIEQHELSSLSLPRFLEEQKKPEWAACRWVYVNGLEWNIVKCLGERHALHRLALEDVLHASSPTKIDWYNDHCFIVMTLQNLLNIRSSAVKSQLDEHSPRPSHIRTWPTLPNSKSYPIVSGEKVSVFLTSDNTIITIFERFGHKVFTPIFTLLESPQAVVRSSNDPSMLLHAVIDTIVDLSLPIGKAYGEAFRDLEQDVLMNPTIAQSRELYALRSELTSLSDKIIPIGSVVGMLRDHCSPVLSSDLGGLGPVPQGPSSQQQPAPNSARLISPTARTYLADVQDHVRVLENSTLTSIRSAENLTSLIFNTITAKQNESVRQLTLVSIFFLPLTFLTGYFGMNFDPMPVVNENSDVIFWWIAGPLMGAVIIVMGTRAVWARVSLGMRRRRTARMRLRERERE